MKTLILYKSNKGSTKQYALWLKEAIDNSDVYSIEEFNTFNFNNYERIIIGSFVIAGKIAAINYIINNFNSIKDKKLIIFTVGLMDTNHESSVMSYNSIPSNIKNIIKYVKLPGRIDYNKLNIFEKLIIKVVKPKFFGEYKKDNINEVLSLL